MVALGSAIIFFASQETSTVEFSRSESSVDTAKTQEAGTSSSQQVSEDELLPDIRVFEPRDVKVVEKDDRTLLVFSTIYYNQGEGPLELVADPDTADEEGDVERSVFQNIYNNEDEIRQVQVGTFVWHGEHGHYHFSDFVDFRLEPTSKTTDEHGVAADDISAKNKATFCVRDVSRVYAGVESAPDDAIYRVCDKEKQGVSVGWGDTYFFDYPDQDIDVTDLPAGEYRLVFEGNPERRFRESNHENNVSWALIELDPESQTVDVLELEPSDPPEVEHLYPEQDFESGASDIEYINQWETAKKHRNTERE